MANDDGYIKFSYDWENVKIAQFELFEKLNMIRRKLYDMGFIGKSGKISFGNISVRLTGLEFAITGTNTGDKRVLNIKDMAVVKYFDITKNYIRCIGEIVASSESLSHAAVYLVKPNVTGVIHIHNEFLWNHYYNRLPTTDVKAAYGTVMLAKEIKNKVCVLGDNMGLVLGGHKPGLLFWGKTLDNAFRCIKRLLEQIDASYSC